MAKINQKLKIEVAPDFRDKDSMEYGPVVVDYDPSYCPVEPPVSEAIYIEQRKGCGRSGKDTILLTVNQIDQFIKALRDVQDHYRACVEEESRPKPQVGLRYRQRFNDHAIYEVISIVSDGEKDVVTAKYIGCQTEGPQYPMTPAVKEHYIAYPADKFAEVSSDKPV